MIKVLGWYSHPILGMQYGIIDISHYKHKSKFINKPKIKNYARTRNHNQW